MTFCYTFILWKFAMKRLPLGQKMLQIRHRQYQYQVLRFWVLLVLVLRFSILLVLVLVLVLRFWGFEVLRYWGFVWYWYWVGPDTSCLKIPKIQDHPNVFSHCLQGYVFIAYRLSVGPFSCTFKMPLWLKAFSHLEQANGFSPVWVLSCSFKCALF